MILNLLAAAVSSGMPSALANSLDSYVEGLFSLARDPSSSVQKAVCTGLVHVLQLQPELLMPQMHNVIEYMLESTQVRRSPLRWFTGDVDSVWCHC